MDVIVWIISTIRGVLGFLLKTVARALWHGTKTLFRSSFERKSNTFGDARWATAKDLRTVDAFSGEGSGLIAGKLDNRIIRFNGEGAMMAYARQGSGKGAGLIIPNLLEYEGAVFVTDPKGENYAITHRQRKALTNGPVYRLDLAHPDLSDNFNPLDIIRVDTVHEKDDAETLAGLLIKPDSNGVEFWDKQAVGKVGAMLQHLCRAYRDHPSLRKLSTLRAELFGSVAKRQKFLEEMAHSDSPTVAEAGHSMLEMLGLTPASLNRSGDLGGSVIATIDAATSLWSGDSGPGQITMRSDFNLFDVIKQKGAVFFIVPEEKLGSMSPFLRVMLGVSTMAIQRYKREFAPPEDAPKPLVVFDECAALGRMDQLEQFMGWMRAYAKAILVFQDRNQIHVRYGREGAQTILNACACTVTFAISDNETAREWAEKIGQRTVQTRNSGQSQASTDLLRHQNQYGVGEAGYYLCDPAQLQRLGSHDILVALHNLPVIKGTRIEYWKEPRWKGKWDTWIEARPDVTIGSDGVSELTATSQEFSAESDSGVPAIDNAVDSLDGVREHAAQEDDTGQPSRPIDRSSAPTS